MGGEHDHRLAVLRLIGMDMAKLVDRPLEEILDMPEVQKVFDSTPCCG